MARLSIQQVVSAVRRLRRGRRGVRLDDVVDYMTEKAVRRALDTAVRNGTLRREGGRFRLVKRLGRMRASGRGSAAERRGEETHGSPPNRYNTRASRNTKRCRSSSWSGQTSRGSWTSDTTNQYNWGAAHKTRRKNPMEATGDYDQISSAHSRLLSARDSLELIRERIPSRSSGSRVTDRSGSTQWSASSFLPKFRW